MGLMLICKFCACLDVNINMGKVQCKTIFVSLMLAISELTQDKLNSELE